MYTASDLRKNLKIEMEGVPYIVVEFNFVKPGKGQAMYNCRLKNMLTGGTVAKTFRAADKIDKPDLLERHLVFSFADGDHYVFTDENYEQVSIAAEVLGDRRYFLVENIEITVLFHNGRPIDVEFPNFVVQQVVETEPGYRGNTATNVLKPAKLSSGYQIQVPLFINQGDVLRIDTRTGEYVDRVR